MGSRKSRLSIFLVILVLVSLSCQLLPTGQATPEAETPAASATSGQTSGQTPGAAPTQTTAPTAAPPAETPALAPQVLPPAQPGPDTLDLDSLPDRHPLTDFNERYHVEMSWTDADGAQQNMATIYQYVQQSQPELAWFTLFEDNNPFISQKFETALAGGQGYSATSETGCQVVGAEKLNSDEQRQPFTSLMEGLTGTTRLAEAEEMVGDQATDVYPVEITNLKPGTEIVLKGTAADSSGDFSSTSTTTLQLTEDDSTLESGKLHLARQGGYVLRLELVYSRTAGEEDAPLAAPGSLMKRTFLYEAIPTTVPGEPIRPPVGCEALTGTGEDTTGDTVEGTLSIQDIPRLDDAANVVQTQDSLIYQTGRSLQETIDFYRAEMSAAGWQVTDEIILGALGSMEMERGSQTASITLTQSGSSVLVTIILG